MLSSDDLSNWKSIFLAFLSSSGSVLQCVNLKFKVMYRIKRNIYIELMWCDMAPVSKVADSLLITNRDYLNQNERKIWINV